MADTVPTAPTAAPVRQPPALARAWQRISPSLVPILAVITALLITIPFMVFTGGGGDFNKGLNIAGTAYSALLEGSIGVAINRQVSRSNLDQFLALEQSTKLQNRTLRVTSRQVADLVTIGVANVQQFGDVLARLPNISANDLKTLSASINDIATIGVDKLKAMRPLIDALAQMDRTEAGTLAQQYGSATALTADQRSALNTQFPTIPSMSDADVLAALKLVVADGIARVERAEQNVDALAKAGINPVNADGTLSADAQAILKIVALNGGADTARTAVTTLATINKAGVVNVQALADQIEIVRALYTANLLTNNDVTTAINTELDKALASNLVVSRPGDRLLIDHSTALGGIIPNNNNTPNNPSDDYTEAAYLRLGDSALLFFPTNLEEMLIRSIPFIIAGLAVALGFKAGLFNIGAEGQLYAGGIIAAWVGFSPIFAGLPLIIHLPLCLVVGIIGGALWGSIPGILKAYTGAHEVITTIMLNYVAIDLTDWMIKSPSPVILLDTTASTPRTPYLVASATMPTFKEIPWWGFILAGIAVLLLSLYGQRRRLQGNPRLAIRPVIYGLLTAVGGLLLAWVGQRGLLHIGLILMLGAVWFTDWFLNKTTPGFELRTVGSNPDAARYAGMNVKWNIVLALALSGALAGLAGTIEITAVQHNMQPEFFAGVGFDAIAVALLA
ncbi:MAG TPA: ABC transporter permease, partial [Phototrophicaceae bacterium]|nr:ABC transporter permease [Phototrophicaceae bacterium]